MNVAPHTSRFPPSGLKHTFPQLWEYCLLTAPRSEHHQECPPRKGAASGAAHVQQLVYIRMSRTRPFTLIWDNSEGSLQHQSSPQDQLRAFYVTTLQFNFSFCLILLLSLPPRCCSEHLRANHPHANLYQSPFPKERNIRRCQEWCEEEVSKLGSWSWITASWLAVRTISGGRWSIHSLSHVVVVQLLTFVGGDLGHPAGAKYSAGNI